MLLNDKKCVIKVKLCIVSTVCFVLNENRVIVDVSILCVVSLFCNGRKKLCFAHFTRPNSIDTVISNFVSVVSLYFVA